jgi:hypothetical protein
MKGSWGSLFSISFSKPGLAENLNQSRRKNKTSNMNEIARVPSERMETQSDMRNLDFLESSGILDQFPGLGQKTDVRSPVKEASSPRNALLIPESLTPILDFYMLPPYSNGVPIIQSAVHAVDSDKDNNAHDILTPYYSKTSLVDKSRGEINLALVAGRYSPTRYPCDTTYPFGHMTSVGGRLEQELDLLTAQDKSHLLRVTASIELPVPPAPDANVPGIQMLIGEKGSYYDHISCLVTGDDPYRGLVGVSGDFRLTVGANDGFTNGTSSFPFLSRFQVSGALAQGYYIPGFNIITELFIPAGIQKLRIFMQANIASYCCTDYPIPYYDQNNYGPMSLVGFRNFSSAQFYPIFKLPFYEFDWGPIANNSIKVRNLHLQFFDTPPPETAPQNPVI